MVVVVLVRGGGRPGVYTDHQVEKSVHKSVRGVVIGPFDTGLGEERPERPTGLTYYEVKRGRVAPPVSLLLNGAPFESPNPLV